MNVYYNQLIDDGGMITTNGCAHLVAIVIGDYDGDGEVDLADYGGFVQCQLGPGISPSDPLCASVDMDQDAAGFTAALGNP